MADPHDDAFAALETAINALTALVGDDYMAVDAVLIIGMQSIDEDGDRVGGTNVFPRHGSQPTYISAGLIESAKALVLRDYTCSSD